MGRSSKFNFPIPGRKRKDATPALVPPPPVGGSLSKAQRILGTTSDFTTGTSQIPEEDHPRRLLGSTSGGMTISISDSSVGSIREQEPRHHEPEALSRNHVLNQKASSATLLRTPHLEDGITATSDRSRPLTNKDSSSTLRSGYDRRKIQLSISQQTSASSARDMALRKGYPSPAQRSPLLDEVSLDQLDDQFGVVNKQPNEMPCFDSSEVPERKKKLHLSTLFTKSRKAGEKPPDSGYVSPNLSSSSADGSRRATFFPEVARRKLVKSQSRESLQSRNFSIRSGKSSYQTNEAHTHSYDHYDNSPAPSLYMDQIPESRVVGRLNTRDRPKNGKDYATSMANSISEATKHAEPRLNVSERELFPRNKVRSITAPNLASSNSHPQNLTSSILVPSPWDSTSAASISSRNTRTSKNTAGSMVSQDLQEDSVFLSLSSDTEDESDDEFPTGLSSRGKSKKDLLMDAFPLPRDSKLSFMQQQPGGPTARSHGQRKVRPHEAPYLAVSERSTNRQPGPWPPPSQGTPPPSSHQNTRLPTAKSSDKSSSIRSGRSSQFPKAHSTTSTQSLQNSSPPSSPSSMTSRFMAVTEQEEALLEALRQKRSRMREEINEEHESIITPPQVVETHAPHLSTRASVNTIRQPSSKQQAILLYLETPLPKLQHADQREASPDLDDFLSFGSDDDSTPRQSWAPSRRDKTRADSSVAPSQRQEARYPLTPPAARLSAVGASRGFKPDRPSGLASTGKEKRSTGVRFVDEERIASQENSLVDDGEPELWLT
ncbi:hypothetical protein LZ554_003577 [Drepanopeziza brunnea f. sp. 'monogermtubi']|nr:hypothetical protein LZ554_003577 [Drepanopeziza brunnea f. sp. 'monogermtubi']